MTHRIRVYPEESDVLCPRCQYGRVTRRRQGQTTTICTEDQAMEVPGDIVSCSEFLDRAKVSKRDLELIAWRIRHDKSGKITGFEPPAKKKEYGGI